MEQILQNSKLQKKLESKKIKFDQKLAEGLKISENEERNFLNSALIQDESQNIQSQFKCFICKKLAHNIKVCNRCDDGIFCQICVSEWHQTNGSQQKCPCCHQNYDSLREPDKFVLKLRNQNLKFKCPYQDCDLQGVYQDFDKISNHMSECLKSRKSINCPNECGFRIKTFEQGQKHFKECQKGLQKCKNCPKAYIRDELSYHQQECSGQLQKCSYCNAKIKRCELEKHVLNVCVKNYINSLIGQNQQIKNNVINQNIIGGPIKDINQNIFGVQSKQIVQNVKDGPSENSTECQQCGEYYQNNKKSEHNCIIYLKKLLVEQSQIIKQNETQFQQYINNLLEEKLQLQSTVKDNKKIIQEFIQGRKSENLYFNEDDHKTYIEQEVNPIQVQRDLYRSQLELSTVEFTEQQQQSLKSTRNFEKTSFNQFRKFSIIEQKQNTNRQRSVSKFTEHVKNNLNQSQISTKNEIPKLHAYGTNQQKQTGNMIKMSDKLITNINPKNQAKADKQIDEQRSNMSQLSFQGNPFQQQNSQQKIKIQNYQSFKSLLQNLSAQK